MLLIAVAVVVAVVDCDRLLDMIHLHAGLVWAGTWVELLLNALFKKVDFEKNEFDQLFMTYLKPNCHFLFQLFDAGMFNFNFLALVWPSLL